MAQVPPRDDSAQPRADGRTALALAAGNTWRAIELAVDTDPRLTSPESKRAYRRDLIAFEEWRVEQAHSQPMTKLLVERYAAYLLATPVVLASGETRVRSPNSVNRTLACIRWWARKVGDIAAEAPLSDHERREITEQAGRIASVSDVRGGREQKGRHVQDGEIAALSQACAGDPSPAGLRDAALIALAVATGARRSELASLERHDLEPTQEGTPGIDVVIRHGKGDKARRIPVADSGALQALNDWLALRGPTDGPLFCPITKGHRIRRGRSLSDEALAQMLAKRALQAGVVSLTWHDFRRTFAGNLLDEGTDLATVQQLMGHASPTTTSLYDRRDEHARRRAVRVLHWPYQARRQASGDQDAE